MHTFENFDIDNNLIQTLNQALELINLKISTQQKLALIKYIELLKKWNKVYNLTSITDSYEILVKHIIDCLTPLPDIYKHIEYKILISDNIKVPDIGSGAGLPSIIWAIVNPNWHIYSIDAVHKKISFQQQVKLELNLNNFFPEHIRIQNFNLKGNINLKIDIVTARAYADTKDIIEQSQNLLTDNGFFALLKGKDSQEFNLEQNIYTIQKINLKPPFLEGDRNLIIIDVNKK